MRPIINRIASLGIVFMASSISAQEPATSYEDFPVLQASQLLKPEFLNGPYHTVMEAVPTQGFANQYTVTTKWGIFNVRGNHLLNKRIHEFKAIAKLEEASKGEEFQKALASAAAKPFYAVSGALKDPVGAVEKIGSGAGRLFRKAGEAISRGGKKSANTDNAMASILGFSAAKRKIAGELQVDPYSENQVLQTKLDDLARASFAGGFVVKAGTFALGTGANIGFAKAVGTVNLNAEIAENVYQNDPTTLSLLNREILLELGLGEVPTDTFLKHPKITPAQQTILTKYLQRFGSVPGIEDYLKMVESSQDTAEVVYFIHCLSMMADYHEATSPAKRILNLFGLPALHCENGTLLIPLAVDYGSWSSESARLSAALASYNPQVIISQRVLYIEGRLSDRARKEFEAQGFTVKDGINTPLYK